MHSPSKIRDNDKSMITFKEAEKIQESPKSKTKDEGDCL